MNGFYIMKVNNYGLINGQGKKYNLNLKLEYDLWKDDSILVKVKNIMLMVNYNLMVNGKMDV